MHPQGLVEAWRPSLGHLEFFWYRNKTVLAQLNTNHRQLLELFYYSGFSLMEIAEQQQLAYATIKTDFRAALLALRNLK